MKTPAQFRAYLVELLTTGDEAISASVAQEVASQIIETLEANPEVSRAFAASETRAFEKEPFAWAVKLASGVESLVYHPIEGNLELQPGDVAYPLFREVYTQAQIDAADAEAKRLVGGLNIV